MDIKELNKPQLILLAVLLSFITSIATGITTVALMEQAPTSVIAPVNKIIRETVEKVVPVETLVNSPITKEQQKLLEDLKAIKPLTVSLYQKGEKEDKILGTGLFLGENKVIIASKIEEPKEGEVYVVKSILGEKKILKINVEEDFTIIELSSLGDDKTTKEGASSLTPVAPVKDETIL